jgi:undecaprenyl-diphosphatase
MEKPNLPLIGGFAAAAAALLLFGWLATHVLLGQTLQFDQTIRESIHRWASPRLTYVMRGVTDLGAPRFLIPLALILVWRLLATGRKRAAWVFLAAAVGAEALDQILKLIFRRARPDAFFGYPIPYGYSFPSGHSVVSCCFYGVAAAILTVRMRSPLKKAITWAAAATLAFAIGLSRVYLGVHHPSDVLAGFAAAVIWVTAVHAGYVIWMRRRAPPGDSRE